MSSFVCPICRDLLTDPQDIEPGKVKADYHPLVTYCGHLFHQYCLRSWTSIQKDAGSSYSCPSCHERIVEPDVVRLNPTRDHNFEDYHLLLKRTDKNAKRLTHIRARNENLKKSLNIALAEKETLNLSISKLESEIKHDLQKFAITLQSVESPMKDTKKMEASVINKSECDLILELKKMILKGTVTTSSKLSSNHH